MSTLIIASSVQPLLDTVAASVATALGGLLVAIATQLLRHLNLSLTASQDAQVRAFAERTVHTVEERIKADGPVKLEQAVARLEERYPDMPIREMHDLIHAEIARQRADVGNQLFQPKAAATQ